MKEFPLAVKYRVKQQDTIFVSILYSYQFIVEDNFGLFLVNYPTTEQLRYQFN